MASSKVMTSSESRNSDLSSPTTTPTASRSRRASSGVPVASSSSFTTTTTIAATNSGTPQQQQQATSFSFSDQAASATMTVDAILRDVYGTPSAESTLLDAQITLSDPPNQLPPPETDQEMSDAVAAPAMSKTVDDVWREIVAGRREMKEEQADGMMTLEDFLVKAGAAVPAVEEVGDLKMQAVTTERLSGGVYAFDPVVSSTPSNAFQVLDKMEGSIVGFGSNGMDHMVGGGGRWRGKRGRSTSLIEPLDKATQQRQRRMIKNRESAARSRERKQAYQVELESLAVRLEEENERLLKEKEERTKERFKQLMEKVIPVVEKRRPPRALRRIRSFEW